MTGCPGRVVGCGTWPDGLYSCCAPCHCPSPTDPSESYCVDPSGASNCSHSVGRSSSMKMVRASLSGVDSKLGVLKIRVKHSKVAQITRL